MKTIRNLFVWILPLALSVTGFGQAALVYDNQVTVVNNGRVNDPHFPVFLMHADNFSLTTNAIINEVSWLGAYKNGDYLPSGDNFTILFFGFQAGIPATNAFASFPVGAVDRQMTTGTLSPYGYPIFSYSARFPDLQLPAGTYLIAIMNNPIEDDRWMWLDLDSNAAYSYMMLFAGTPWREASGGAEFAFSLSYVTDTPPDTTPPEITAIAATPTVLWPPNHRMVTINLIVNATDDTDPAPVIRIAQVTSNEPQNPFAPDAEITGPLSLNLRAERLGKKTGRIYTILVECEDAAGNVSSASVDVTVPHDRR